MSKKGQYHQQLSAMTQFFKGYHVHIQARSEEDIKPEVILKKVKDASGAKYGIHKEKGSSAQEETPAPVVCPVVLCFILYVNI